jgi:hypothetical protein
VRELAGDDLLASDGVGQMGDEVALGAASDEDSRLFAEEVGRHHLQPVDGRVLPIHIVADLGTGHHLTHLR